MGVCVLGAGALSLPAPVASLPKWEAERVDVVLRDHRVLDVAAFHDTELRIFPRANESLGGSLYNTATDSISHPSEKLREPLPTLVASIESSGILQAVLHMPGVPGGLVELGHGDEHAGWKVTIFSKDRVLLTKEDGSSLELTLQLPTANAEGQGASHQIHTVGASPR